MKRTASIALALLAAPAWSAGFPNQPQTPGALLSGLNAPQQGRTAIIAYHNGILFTVPELPSSQPGADFQVRTWDIADPTDPVELAQHGISPMPINAHGYFQSGNYLILGSNWPPEAPWSFRAEPLFGQLTRTEFPELLCAGVRGCLFGPWLVDGSFWSYGEVTGNATVSKDWGDIVSWDHLGQTGVIGHPFLIGDLLIYASDQSRTGVATYDLSAYMDGDPGNDPASPPLLDVLTTGGPGGYWPEIWSGDGKLYVVFPYRTGGNGIRVVDASDPSNLRLVADVPLPGAEAMYMQFQDEYGFAGDHKIDMRTFQSVLFLDGANVTRPSDGGLGVDTSQFALPLGNLLVTGGIGPDEGMAIWAHQAAPDTRGPAVTWHVPQAGRTNYPIGAPISLLIHETLDTTSIVNGSTFIVRPLGGSALPGRLTFAFDDVLTFVPDAPLLANTTYEVVLPAGGIEDAAGNGMVGYAFTFSTGSAVGGNLAPVLDSLSVSSYPVPPGVSATLAASASDPNSDPLEYRFDFGDGSPKTAWSSTPSTAWTWSAPGHYRISAQVRDNAGAIATRSRTVTVLDPPAGPRPTASSQVACDQAGRRVWTVNPDADTLAAVHADTLSLDLEVPICADPRAVARAATGELWVACYDDDTVRVASPGGALLETITLPYGSAPAGLVASPNGATVYVTLEGRGELRRYDAATRGETGILGFGPTPSPVSTPRALAVSPDGSRIFVARFLSPRDWGELWEVSAASFTLTRTIRLPKLGGDLNRDSTAAGRGTPNQLASIAISPDGNRAWIAATKPNAERGLLFGPDLDSDNTVRNILVEVDLVANAMVGAIDLDNSDSASAVAFSPLGDYLFVTLQGNGEVQVLDALALGSSAGLGSFFTRLGAGGAPQGVCADGPSQRIFVSNLTSRELTAFDAVDMFEAGDIVVPGVAVATVANEPLPPTVLLGKQLFYDSRPPRMSAEGYLACATCHLDGGSDGRVWDFTGRGEGLRNTVELRGRAGMQHGNVHWSANFDEIQDFENDIRLAFGGSGLMDDSDFAATGAPLGPVKAGLSLDLDALAAYVSSLGNSHLPRSPYRQPDGASSAAAVAGGQLFDGLGCPACHAGADLSDSTVGAGTLHDVGTLRTTSGGRLGGPLPGIDTPTLRGLWQNAPYFHDGSARTLAEVFTVAGGEVIPAESGTPTGGASIQQQWVDLNHDDTVHGRALAAISGVGQTLTLSGVDGGSGGTGAVELRVSTAGAVNLDVRVNGVPRIVALPSVGNDPNWRHTNWAAVRVENVALTAGASNTIQLIGVAGWPSISIDEVVVTTAGDLAAAAPHRIVGSLTPTERSDLLAFLLELDGSPLDVGLLFEDGFESGNTSAWSASVP